MIPLQAERLRNAEGTEIRGHRCCRQQVLLREKEPRWFTFTLEPSSWAGFRQRQPWLHRAHGRRCLFGSKRDKHVDLKTMVPPQTSRTTTSCQKSEIHSFAAIRSSLQPPRSVYLPSRYLTSWACPKEATTSPSSLNQGKKVLCFMTLLFGHSSTCASCCLLKAWRTATRAFTANGWFVAVVDSAPNSRSAWSTSPSSNQ